MGQSKLVIVIPTKTTSTYSDRIPACLETWLKDCPCDFKMLSDADMGLKEIDQHDNANDPIRTLRMKGMTQWCYDAGYEYLFRCDTDTYVWVNRLLHCGFEKHDYMGLAGDYAQPNQRKTAHGGVGFFLSRKAMQIVKDAPVEKTWDGKYWGDMWAGMVLFRRGIHCKRDTRFMDGGGHRLHNGNILADELPLDHPYIAIHPVNPNQNFYDLHKRFPKLSDVTIEPDKQLWE